MFATILCGRSVKYILNCPLQVPFDLSAQRSNFTGCTMPERLLPGSRGFLYLGLAASFPVEFEVSDWRRSRPVRTGCLGWSRLSS